MPWVKLDDDFPEHHKTVRAGRDARDLFIASLFYSAKNLKDGKIERDVLGHLAVKAGIEDADTAAARLVEVGFWEATEHGWTIHDYHDYNPTAEQVKREREDARERMRKARSGEVRANSHGSSANPVPSPVPVPISESNIGVEKSEAPPVAATVPVEPRPKKSKAEPIPKRPAYPAEFQAFMDAYPGPKAGRSEAFPVWEKAKRAGYKPADLERAAANYRRHCEAEQTAPKYIKTPANFIQKQTFVDFIDWTPPAVTALVRSRGDPAPTNGRRTISNQDLISAI